MFGSPSVAAWGTPEWGTVLPKVSHLFQVDSVAKALDVDRLWAVDVLAALLGVERSAFVDSVVLGTAARSFAVDFLPQAMEPTVWNKLDVAPYLLVEIQLPGGTVRVSERCRTALGAVWDARLKSSGQILRTIGAGTDDMTLVLDDTDTEGQARFRDLFTASDPEGALVLVWLGAEGLTDQQHLPVFQGKLEHVAGFTYAEVTLRVVRREAVEDQLLGQLVDQLTFPSAPPESVGRMLPVVFGTVAASEGLVIDTNAVTTLLRNLTDSSLIGSGNAALLADIAGFPIVTARVQIGEELIDYAIIAGTELVGLTRGVAGTTATSHPAGAEVSEVGLFAVRFAGHPLSVIENVKLLLPTDRLGDPVPQPLSIDYATATATWDALPQIRDPLATSVYQRVHFDLPGPANTAGDPQYSARENAGYEAFKVSRVPVGTNLSLLTHVDGLGEPGDIEAVWFGVIFDPDSIAQGFSWAAADIGGSGGDRFWLVPSDHLPDEIARRDEKTGDRIYDVPAPAVNTVAPSPQPFSLTPKVVIHPGIWATQSNAKRVVDEDADTCAAYMFIGIGEAQIFGTADAEFKVDDQQTLPTDSGATATSAKIVFIAGWDLTPFTSSFELWLEGPNGEIAGTRFRACDANPPAACVGLIRGKKRFEHPIDPAIVGVIKDVRWVVHPQLGVSNGLWVGCELFIEGEVSPAAPVINIVQDTRGSVTNYFEVTHLLPSAARPGGPVLDWSWFGNFLTGGVANLSTAFAGDPEGLKVIETFYVVKHRPFTQANTREPRVFADVVGQVPGGQPTEIARALVVQPQPLGLGLGAARVEAGSYQAAQVTLDADSVRADFTVYNQVSVLQLLQQLAAETDCRETWDDQARHRITRRPRAGTSLPTVASFGDCDLMQDKRLTLTRSSVALLVNRLEVRWRIYAPSGLTSAAVRLDDGPSQTNLNFGIQAQQLDLVLLASNTAAQLVAQRKLERQALPRWIVELDAPPFALNLQRGDLVTLAARDFSFEVGEVTQVNFTPNGFRRVSLQIAVWKV